MYVYILYSYIIDHYYIGFTADDIEKRVEKHLTEFYKNKFTSQTKDWKIFLKIKCDTENQARQIGNTLRK